MLAGYLPFDDDPANPEGDNINLLYKYIVSTPLTFPEYVTPHARDLLKRILVPDPRKRADLFEVARHSWLADYAHVVGFITSSNTNAAEAQQASVYSSRPSYSCLVHHVYADPLLEDTFEPQPALARSASVREPAKPHIASSAHGGLQTKRDAINQTAEKPKPTRDTKRRTVQVEYVAPSSQTARGEASPPAETLPKTRGKEAEVAALTDGHQSVTGARPSRSSGAVQAPARKQEPQRSTSDYAAFASAPTSATRPSTSGALGASRLPSRGNSYGQPSVATVAQTNAEGRFSQPKGKQYSISAPYTQHDASEAAEPPNIGQPSAQRTQSIQMGPQGPKATTHRRSNTVTETLGRMTSMFSGRQPSYNQDPKASLTSQGSYGYPDDKKQRSYPPTSMAGPMSNDNISATTGPRPSMESSRRTSFGFSRKNNSNSSNHSNNGNNGDNTKPSRRFSLIPSSLSRTFTSRDSAPSSQASHERRASSSRPRASSRPGGMSFGRGGLSRSPSQSTQGSNMPGVYDGHQDRLRNMHVGAAGPSSAPPNQTHFNSYNQSAAEFDEKFPNPQEAHPAAHGGRPYQQTVDDSDGSEAYGPGRISISQQYGQRNTSNPYPPGMGGDEFNQQQQRKGVLQKSRRFADAYDEQGSANKGSSGSSKKVMDFFRRIGKQRTSSR